MRVLSKSTGRPLDIITLRDLVVRCVIGVNPDEKIRSQPLRLDIRLYLDASSAGLSGALARTIDYSLVAKQIAFILSSSRFRLLESAAEALAACLLTPAAGHVPIEAVDIEISKPEALGGEAIPSIRIFREEPSPGPWIKDKAYSVLFQVPEAVVERKVVAAKSDFILEEKDGLAVMSETHGLLLAGRPLAAGSTLVASQRIVLHNPAGDDRTILIVTFRGRERYQPAHDRLH
jgi:FolB domain-containing protein